ncbi:MAG: hypothetical protein DHS20C18_24000 [Saprospiraceae bacterium]|nr:MAG: hypothetical protein DHS20C18_24000 [Saprospiraceae bacterium]
MFHGWGKTHNFFEGWYFKIVDPTEQYVFAVIPGISRGIDGQHHAFIQVLDGKQCQASYHDFGVADFQASGQKFAIDLGGNHFSATDLRLRLPELEGDLQINQLTPWPKMLGAPGIMGWYSFVPFMQCYHGVVSVNHELQGSLKVHGKAVDFSGGKGYIEKDWGRSFPSSWIWIQTNHFDADRPVSLMASIANIPWIGSHFIGCIVGFLYGDKLYRFATYTGAKRKASIKGKTVQLAFTDRKYRLEIIAHQAGGGELISPLSGNMTGKVNESMQATVEVKFYRGEHLVFAGTGRNAGLEVAGTVDELLTNKWRT